MEVIMPEQKKPVDDSKKTHKAPEKKQNNTWEKSGESHPQKGDRKDHSKGCGC